ncbi:hypothetical protein TWF694_000322 [Orbilia ellipsospora]|uniref:Major facilitator superfamily (MFS) profile domain-containing protein n=1 Tax=Orbilia ellipsospora TaxID=2528407 RepID=A0AAV9XNB0_9PEZI
MSETDSREKPNMLTTNEIEDIADREAEDHFGAVVLDVGLDAEKHGHTGYKLAADGHTVLIPQPSEDPDDPLNWSSFKKHMLLFILALSAFCGDFGSGAGIPCIVLQGAEWGMNPSVVNYAGNLNVIMLGIGGVFWIPFTYWWGRAPVLFWTTFAGALFTLGATLAPNFTVFYGMRALMGFTLTACQTIGLSFVKDMFFFHEHARKIGIWAAIFLVSAYLGPCLGNFIISGTGEWRNVFWVVFGLCCFDLILIVLFADETWYIRNAPQKTPRGNRLLRLVGVWQVQNHKELRLVSFPKSWMRLVKVLFRPTMLPIMFYYMLSFMWAVGINITTSILFETPQSAGGYGFGAKSVGYIYFTPLVAVTLGEFFGHFFNDFMANRYIRQHNGVFEPECRLWTNYIAAFFMIPGLIIVGFGLQDHLHYMSLVMGWGMYVFGVLIASVAITAYALDSYPTAAGEVSGFLNFARTIGGFSVGYFQQPWGAASGYAVSFGIQAAIVAVAIFVLASLHIYGKRMRVWGGPLHL